MRFTDLPDTSWAYSYIAHLWCGNVISGFPDGTFRPNANVTRGQFTKMVIQGFGLTWQVPASATFKDVPLGSTYSPFVETAARLGIATGYQDSSFRPNDPVTRAQAVKMLVLAAGWSPLNAEVASFSDVPLSHWASVYIEAAYFKGIINGYPDWTFRPQNSITRAQVSKVVALATAPWLPRSKPSKE